MEQQITVLTSYHEYKEKFIEIVILNETIPSAVFVTSDTSICATANAPLKKTGIRSKKVFMVATGDV